MKRADTQRYTLTDDMRIQDATGRILPLREVVRLLNERAAMGAVHHDGPVPSDAVDRLNF